MGLAAGGEGVQAGAGSGFAWIGGKSLWLVPDYTRGFEEARRRLQNAAEIDPLSLGPQLNQVEELSAEQNYQEAKRKVDQILRTAPSNAVALSEATSVGFWQRDCSSAKAASDKLKELYPK